MPELVKAASLVLDPATSPRQGQIIETLVTEYVHKLEAGEILPPIEADPKTQQVVKGWHRVKAHLRHFGEEAEILTEWKEYADDRERFLAAAEDNSAHGQCLSHYDQAYCLIRAEALGIIRDRITSALRITTERSENLEVRKVAKAPDLTPIPLKRTAAHLAGKRLTEPQMVGHKAASGMAQVFYVNQIINLLNNDLLDGEDVNLLERLQQLFALLQTKFA